jgi:hypothetical protein
LAQWPATLSSELGLPPPLDRAVPHRRIVPCTTHLRHTLPCTTKPASRHSKVRVMKNQIEDL